MIAPGPHKGSSGSDHRRNQPKSWMCGMRWVKEEPLFTELLTEAHECIFVDSRRKPTDLRRLIFDDVALRRPEFACLLQTLLGLSGDSKCYYLVLSPDPVHYFHRQFNKYPLLEIDYGDSNESYLAFLNEDPGGSPADAVGINWWACVILPPSRKWFSHLLRSANDNGGHLWIPRDWAERVIEWHPYLRVEPGGNGID